MDSHPKAKLVASTIAKKNLVLCALHKYAKTKRPRIPKGKYVRCFGKLIDVSSMDA